MSESKRLVYVVWADAMQNLEGWKTIMEAKDWAQNDDWLVEQVGWILEETNRYLLLGSLKTDGPKGSDEQASLIFKIPKPWIKHIEDITLKLDGYEKS